MQQCEALNAAGVCDQSDRFNCKYCRRAGRDCKGYAGGIGSNPTPAAGTKRPKPPANPPRLNGPALPPHFVSEFNRARRRLVREETIEYPKTTDVHRGDDGALTVVETWLFEFPDGEFDFLQRRHPVTDPAEIEALNATA